MNKEYIKLTLLNNFNTIIGDGGKSGTSKYWEVLNESVLGSMVIKSKSGVAYIFGKDVVDEVWTSSPTFLVPSGMMFKIEKDFKRTWYGRYFKEASKQ